MTAVPENYQQPKSRKFILGLGALICGLVIYWGEPFSNLTLRKLVPVSMIVFGLILVAPKVGAFLSWSLQRKHHE